MADATPSPDPSTRWIETSRGILRYSELAPLLAERVLRVQERIETVGLTEFLHAQSTSLDDALEGADGDGFAPVVGHDHLPAIGVPPFLVAALLADLLEAVSTEHPNDVPGAANWEALTHVSATSSTFEPLGSATGEGSNQSSSASFALRTASSSVSPAEAQPGSSGKKAAHRFVPGSCSTTSRSFMARKLRPLEPAGNPAL